MEKIKELFKSKVFIVSLSIVLIFVLLSVFLYKKWKDERETSVKQGKLINDIKVVFDLWEKEQLKKSNKENSEEVKEAKEVKKEIKKIDSESDNVDLKLLESYMWNVKDGRLSQRQAAKVLEIPLSTFNKKYHKYLKDNNE